MRKTLQKTLCVFASLVILFGMFCVGGLISSAASAEDVTETARAYILKMHNKVTKAGLLMAVQAVAPSASLEDADFYIQHAVPGVTDTDTSSGYPLNIPGSDGAVAAIFTVDGQRIGVAVPFAHEQEEIDITGVAIVNKSNTDFTFSGDNVTAYRGTANKIVVPANYAGTIAGTGEKDFPGVQVFVLANQTPLPSSAFENESDAVAIQMTDGTSQLSTSNIYRRQWRTSGSMSHFKDCSNLKYLHLPVYVNEPGDYGVIGPYDFLRTAKLENINMPTYAGGYTPAFTTINYVNRSFDGSGVRELQFFQNPWALLGNGGGSVVGVKSDTFTTDGFAAGTRNINFYNSPMSFVRVAALLAAEVNEQWAAGATGNKAIANAKAEVKKIPSSNNTTTIVNGLVVALSDRHLTISDGTNTISGIVDPLATAAPITAGATISSQSDSNIMFVCELPQLIAPAGYKAVEYGTIILPDQFLTGGVNPKKGAELVYGNSWVATAKKELAEGEKLVAGQQYTAELRGSSQGVYPGVRFAYRAYVIYENVEGEQTVLYGDKMVRSVWGVARSITKAVITVKAAGNLNTQLDTATLDAAWYTDALADPSIIDAVTSKTTPSMNDLYAFICANKAAVAEVAGTITNVNKTVPAKHAVKTYITGNSFTEEDFLYTAAYMVDGEIRDTMIDAFVFSPAINYMYDFNLGTGKMKYTKENWLSFIYDDVFEDGTNMDALNKAAGTIKEAIGDDKYKVQVYLPLLYPNSAVTDFGEVNGRNLNLSVAADRLEAVKWLAQEQLRAFNDRNYQNIEVAGFFWFTEEIEKDKDDYQDSTLARNIAEYVRSIGFTSCWSPYFGAQYEREDYDTFGFDIVTMQPNYYPGVPETPNCQGIESLQETANLIANGTLDGCEMEIGNMSDASITGFKQYLLNGVKNKFMNDAYHLWYMVTGPSFVKEMSLSTNAYTRSAYDEMYRYIKGDLTAAGITISQ